MKVGDYVRTQNRIFKITKLNDEYIEIDGSEFKLHYGKMTNDYYFLLDTYDDYETQTIYKSSPNIIDLIEVGDYVNGCPVLHKENNELVCGLLLRYKEENIQNVVTKECFKSMEYKVKE